MAVRTKLLASGRISVVGTTTIYTCPAEETTIIKRIHVYNLNASTNQGVTIVMDAGAFDKTSWDFFNLPATTAKDIETWSVLQPGMELGLNLTTAIGLNYWVSGTELEGVAD